MPEVAPHQDLFETPYKDGGCEAEGIGESKSVESLDEIITREIIDEASAGITESQAEVVHDEPTAAKTAAETVAESTSLSAIESAMEALASEMNQMEADTTAQMEVDTQKEAQVSSSADPHQAVGMSNVSPSQPESNVLVDLTPVVTTQLGIQGSQSVSAKLPPVTVSAEPVMPFRDTSDNVMPGSSVMSAENEQWEALGMTTVTQQQSQAEVLADSMGSADEGPGESHQIPNEETTTGSSNISDSQSVSVLGASGTQDQGGASKQ